jgi:hydroxyacylglutathione hydrolase
MKMQIPATHEITAAALAEAIREQQAPPIVDVRSAAEYQRGHIPGAVHMPFWLVPFRAEALALPRDEPLVVYCGHGPRAQMARVALEHHGFARVILLRGHMRAWKQGRLPLERGVPATGLRPEHRR